MPVTTRIKLYILIYTEPSNILLRWNNLLLSFEKKKTKSWYENSWWLESEWSMATIGIQTCVYVWIKQICSVCNSLNANMQLLIQCILIVAKPLLTRVYVNIMLKMLAPHIVWSVGQTKHSWTQLNSESNLTVCVFI